MNVVSLFSGVGGIEVGLQKHGFEPVLFCESDPIARAVLSRHFPDVEMASDVRELKSLPACEIVTAGFPCQDLSQAGIKRGITGNRSGLVTSVFDLIGRKPARRRPNWLLIENVPYMLSLDRGKAMTYLTQALAGLGYRWAYRVVDARSFGRPQRRPRVVVLASRSDDPAEVLFADEYDDPLLDGRPSSVESTAIYGFYWTEGRRGVGWVREGVPPIKCGSTVGIASPPAVWIPQCDFVGTIDIRDAERLQGLAADWTSLRELPVKTRENTRWRLVGNAVSGMMSEWIGRRLTAPKKRDLETSPLDKQGRWPDAGMGVGDSACAVRISRWASNVRQQPLSEFLNYELKPLSPRATAGFLDRARSCTNVVYSPKFLRSLERHLRGAAA
jgi:DNA (cytosine-5)-methyltransferase 1